MLLFNQVVYTSASVLNCPMMRDQNGAVNSVGVSVPVCVCVCVCECVCECFVRVKGEGVWEN